MKYLDIIERINYFRTVNKLSARELSLLIDKNANYITTLENTYFNIPVPVLLEIIKALGVTEEEFFASNYKSYQKDEEIITKLKTLSSVDKENISNIITALSKK